MSSAHGDDEPVSEETEPQPVYDYEKGVLIVPEGWFDPPPGTKAMDTGLRTARGNQIRIRKVMLSPETPPPDELGDQ